MNKLGTKLGAIAMSAVMAVSFAPSAVITTLAAGSDSTPLDAGEKSIPVYSVWNPGTGEHLFTTVPAEVAMLETLSWIGETPERWYAPTTGDTVYRLARADGGDHFYTANTEEKDILVKDYGWTVDKNSFCTAAATDEKATYVYRLFKNGDGHHYTISWEEASILVKDYGWTLEEGDGFYGYAEDQDSPVGEFSVTINNPTPKVGDTLTAVLTPATAKVATYSWMADGEEVATTTTLLVTDAMVGKKISVKVTQADGTTATSKATSEVEVVAPEILTAVRKAANSFTLTFDSKADEIVKADDITVISEDEKDVKKITGLDFSEDGKTAVVTVSTSFKDKVVYNVTYKSSSASFEASVGEVDKVVIYTDEAEVNTATKIEFALFDENGVDVTSAIKIDETCVLTFEGDYDNYNNEKASNTTVTMTNTGKTCTVTVTYNKNDGTTEPVHSSKDITCVAASEKKGKAFFTEPGTYGINATSQCAKFYKASASDTNVSVPLDTTKKIHFYAQDTDGSAISYDSYEIESADETIANATIDVAQGKWASFDVVGNTKGSVSLTLKATKNGAETTYDIPVTVTTKAVPARLNVALSANTVSNAWDADYVGYAEIVVYAADGSLADPLTYDTPEFELITKNPVVDDDLKGVADYDSDPNTTFKLGNMITKDVNGDKAEGPATKYTAYAAQGKSYIIEGRVTDQTTGKVITNRNTVTVKELPKEAWILGAAVGNYWKGNTTKANATNFEGLNAGFMNALPVLNQEAYNALAATTVSANGTLAGWTAGQDAYVDAGIADYGQTGCKASYAVDMASKMDYGDNAVKTAKLKATMGGLFAGYVHQDGTIGAGKVLATEATRIVVNDGDGKKLLINGYFGDQPVGTTGNLYGMNGNNRVKMTMSAGGTGVLSQTFTTVDGTSDAGYYTDQRDQLVAGHDAEFAKTGEYTVKFTYWTMTATKEIEETAKFQVKNSLYVPTVTVKSQVLDSYTRDGWKSAVVSNVDLNNNEPSTYSVVDLQDKNGATISNNKTPAKWAVVTEDGILYHIQINRTFKLS